MVTVILCGGVGSRLWPISRETFPKQFVSLFGDETLFQSTIKRNLPISDSLIVVTHVQHYHTAYHQLKTALNDNQASTSFILEEVQKNTALALALAAFCVDPEEVVLNVPSDHLIKDEALYQDAVAKAVELAHTDHIVTFGIRPLYAETGFGYLRVRGEDVIAFVEKPTLEVAQSYYDSGEYLWNSGMFCCKARVFLEELKTYARSIYDAAKEAYHKSILEGRTRYISQEGLNHLESVSVDYALMEKSQRVKVVHAEMGWNDVGSFERVDSEIPKDAMGNSVQADIKPIMLASEQNLILSSRRQVALVDVCGMMVVDTPDALLIAKKGSGQKVKQVMEALKEAQSSLVKTHFYMDRPWGSFSVLEEKSGYKIKCLTVLPSRRLSLQKHFHRSEHWVVVSGTALVQLVDKEVVLRPNESIYIPVGEKHRLSNPGKIPLIVIEVQVGTYLEEDDIVRFDDDYRRKKRDGKKL